MLPGGGRPPAASVARARARGRRVRGVVGHPLGRPGDSNLQKKNREGEMGGDSGVLEGFFKDFLEGNFRHCRTRFVVVGRVQIASTKKSVEGAEGSEKAGVESIGHMTAKKFVVSCSIQEISYHNCVKKIFLELNSGYVDIKSFRSPRQTNMNLILAAMILP